MRVRDLCRDERGNVAMLFGLTMLPFCLLVGSAVDFGRTIEFREFARSLGDSAALAVAGADTPDDGATSINAVKQRIASQYGDNVKNLTVVGDWMDSATYRIKVTGDVKAYLLPTVPTSLKGLGAGGLISTSAEVRVVRIPPKYETTPPSLSQLDPEAADYNRISMYCYDPTRKNESDKGRRAMTAIADNGTPGLNYSNNPMPSCKEGEIISFKLRNVRNVRTTPSKWDATGQQVYEYYTDTSMNTGTRVMTNNMVGGRVYDNGTTSAIDMQNNPILETILCANTSECKERKNGGILPNSTETGRTPQTASEGCTEGKMMYYGWEDRPPTGGSDKDYNDIRLIVTCPKLIKVADKELHIVK